VNPHGRAGVPAALLMARWWTRPTVDEIARWGELWPEARRAAQALEIDHRVIDELQGASAHADPELMLEEYERLLVGPGRAPCAPYESLWRSDLPEQEQGSLMGSAADAIERVYAELGVQLQNGAHELPDHLLVEWEALACALDRGADEPADVLLNDHLSMWMAPFCEAVAQETNEMFYVTLAGLTQTWTAALAR
jgi:TorA maturation chaperone TorD